MPLWWRRRKWMMGLGLSKSQWSPIAVDFGADPLRLAPRLARPGVPVADEAGDRSDLYALPLDDVFSFDFGKIQSQY